MNSLLCRYFSRSLGFRCPRPQRVPGLARYASSSQPKPPLGNFENLLTSLRHGMKEDEIARTIAALLLSTNNPVNLSKLESVLPRYLKKYDATKLNKKVEHYLSSSLEVVDETQGSTSLSETTALSQSSNWMTTEANPGSDEKIIDGNKYMDEANEDSEDIDSNPYPDLSTPDILLDSKDVFDIPPDKTSPFRNRVIIRNHKSVFEAQSEALDETKETTTQEESKPSPIPKNSYLYRQLYRSVLVRRSAVHQTGKGKNRRSYYLVLVGNGNGLVGYGEGKHTSPVAALRMAELDALKNMDWVERFEKRTVWTEMETKLGATKLILRPRPVGFGLRCNPYLHQILRAAGIKDISAKVWGNRNRLHVIKAVFRMLHAGHAPTGMGDGLGGPGRTLWKGSGMRTKDDIERARGRKLVTLRT